MNSANKFKNLIISFLYIIKNYKNSDFDLLHYWRKNKEFNMLGE